MLTEHDVILKTLNTIFTGGAFAALLVIAWKGGAFIQWVRSSIERITLDFERFEKSNNEAHERIENHVEDIGNRVATLEENGG